MHQSLPEARSLFCPRDKFGESSWKDLASEHRGYVKVWPARVSWDIMLVCHGWLLLLKAAESRGNKWGRGQPPGRLAAMTSAVWYDSYLTWGEGNCIHVHVVCVRVCLCVRERDWGWVGAGVLQDMRCCGWFCALVRCKLLLKTTTTHFLTCTISLSTCCLIKS